ncbi:MAG TPA: glycoside hydrolase family 76 protein [Candidatus Acidoferrales bacterium]|jgi:predicted alpha-1,6-mannanase (GH76 family)|nr:glycoside hydrolase family 76 protein [Candidatus Acidoferrales bacterium]
MICKKHLAVALVLLAQTLLIFSARAYTPKDANTIFSAYNSAFYIQKGTNGYIKDTQAGGEAYFWGQANMIECYIDAWEWNSNATAQVMITNLLNGFMSYNGANWINNDYNDDIMWAVMAFARGGVATGKTNYCDIAKANFDACYARAWSTNLGGGLYWRNSDRQSKNACVNGPGAIAAYLLYQIYGDTNYLNKATNIYAWERSVLFNTGSGAIYDNIGTNGVIGTWSSSYNQGTFLGAANFLGQTNDAKLSAQFSMQYLCGGGILPEYGIAGNNSGFNAIFWRWFTRFMKGHNLQSTYEPWLQTNAVAAWNVRRAADNLSWCQWFHPSPVGTNFYSWDCISSFEILQAADATQGAAAQSVPANPAGYYPLDATSGTVAVDATGSGNNGVVSGATWNSGGRFNGCLNFNGASSSVQITNLVCNDFSIAFWVKTTQAAGGGQWYNGAGLVDGDAPGSNDDFGAALVGGKFGFGIGNPDTTILSTTSINNGAWHHCVATRQQATGGVNVYVDGTLQASGTANRNTLNASARLLFGAIASGNGYFNGSLDEVKIFSRTLSSNEVVALYSSSIASPTGGPTNLNATAGNAQIQLTWSEAAMATGYNVKRSLVSGGPYVTITNVSTTSFVDTNTANNHTYYYVVSAVNIAGEGANSAEASASPLALAAWFRADAITNVSNGAGVALWPDVSGNGYNAVQTSMANQPVFVSGAINGLPVVRFNSANSSYLWFYRPVQDDFTIIFVYQSGQGISTGTDFWNGAGLVNGEQSGTVDDFGISLNANGQILAGTGNPDRTVASPAGYANSQPHVVTFKRTKSTGVDVLYVDNVQQGIQPGGTQSLTSPNFLVLGGQGVLNNFLTGDIAEVQIYTSPLSDADRLGQERALKCKYGMTGGLTPSAPTGLLPAAGNRQIALNWTMSAGAASYNVWRSTNGGSSYQAVATGLTTSSYVDTNAANGLVNYYKVTGTDACGAGTLSAAASVLLPLPSLGMIAGAGTVALNWPSWASDWKLYATTNLTPPMIWAAVTNAVTSNSQFSVSIPRDADAKLFRLASP